MIGLETKSFWKIRKIMNPIHLFYYKELLKKKLKPFSF